MSRRAPRLPAGFFMRSSGRVSRHSRACSFSPGFGPRLFELNSSSCRVIAHPEHRRVPESASTPTCARKDDTHRGRMARVSAVVFSKARGSRRAISVHACRQRGPIVASKLDAQHYTYITKTTYRRTRTDNTGYIFSTFRFASSSERNEAAREDATRFRYSRSTRE